MGIHNIGDEILKEGFDFVLSHHHLRFFFFLPLFFFGLGELPTDDSEVEPLPIPMALALMLLLRSVLASSSNLTVRLVVIFFLDLCSQNACHGV